MSATASDVRSLIFGLMPWLSTVSTDSNVLPRSVNPSSQRAERRRYPDQPPEVNVATKPQIEGQWQHYRRLSATEKELDPDRTPRPLQTDKFSVLPDQNTSNSSSRASSENSTGSFGIVTARTFYQPVVSLDFPEISFVMSNYHVKFVSGYYFTCNAEYQNRLFFYKREGNEKMFTLVSDDPIVPSASAKKSRSKTGEWLYILPGEFDFLISSELYCKVHSGTLVSSK